MARTGGAGLREKAYVREWERVRCGILNEAGRQDLPGGGVELWVLAASMTIPSPRRGGGSDGGGGDSGGDGGGCGGEEE